MKVELENIAFRFISAETKMLLLCPRHGEGYFVWS